MHSRLGELRAAIVEAKDANEDQFIDELMADTGFPEEVRRKASKRAEELVDRVRESAKLERMDSMLAEYGLETEEGVALLRLAEAFVRIPDSKTRDEFIAGQDCSSRLETPLGQIHFFLCESHDACADAGSILRGWRERPKTGCHWEERL